MPGIHQARGKTFVATEDGEALSVRQIAGNQVMLPNGQRVQVRRAWTTSAIAASTSNAAFIPAPTATPDKAADQFYIAVLAFTPMCDAATLITPVSNAQQIGMSYPIGANGGIQRLQKPSGGCYFRGEPGYGIELTTGAGGNTHADADYIIVPIDVDIL